MLPGTLKQSRAAAIDRKTHAGARPAQRTEPRRRPVRQRMGRAQRMQELVEATIDVLAKKGYAGFTIAEVAKTAGVSTALIIVHFKSKEQLYFAVLKSMATEYFSALRASQIGAGQRAADQLWRLVNAEFSESYFTPRYLAAWKAFWAETNGRKLYVEHFGAETVHFLETTVALCRKIISDGKYKGYDPRIVARLIDTSLGGLWIDLTVTATPVTIAEARKVARSLLALLFPKHFTQHGPRRSP